MLAKGCRKTSAGLRNAQLAPHRTRVRPVGLGSIVTLMRHAHARPDPVMLMIVHVPRGATGFVSLRRVVLAGYAGRHGAAYRDPNRFPDSKA